MFNIFRYIKLRWNLLSAVGPKARRHFNPDLRKKIEKQTKDLAWLIVQNKFADPTFNFRIKAHFTKGRRLIKHCEMSGDIPTREGRIHFVLANPYQFAFRMEAQVYQKGKSSITVQGNIHYCFEMLEAFGTKGSI